MPAKYFSIIRNYVLSVSSQRKYNFYHQNMLLDAFRTNSRNIIGRNTSMAIPLLANQDLTPMLLGVHCKFFRTYTYCKVIRYFLIFCCDNGEQLYILTELYPRTNKLTFVMKLIPDISNAIVFFAHSLSPVAAALRGYHVSSKRHGQH